MDEIRQGRPLAIDDSARSGSPTEPAFVVRPEGAPVYHGFVVLDDVKVDGFTLGKITDWEAEPCETGDAFVIAMDGSRLVLCRRYAIRLISKRSCQPNLPDGECVGRRFSSAND